MYDCTLKGKPECRYVGLGESHPVVHGGCELE